MRRKPQTVGPAKQRIRILLVDDHRWVAESLMKLLILGGHDVRIAGDGPSALEEVSIFRPEIALLDIGLPGMDGYELARCIRKKTGTGPMTLIALTGYGQDEDLHRAREAGFDHHLTKPVECAALFKLISSGCGRSATAEALAPHRS